MDGLETVLFWLASMDGNKSSGPFAVELVVAQNTFFVAAVAGIATHTCKKTKTS